MDSLVQSTWILCRQRPGRLWKLPLLRGQRKIMQRLCLAGKS